MGNECGGACGTIVPRRETFTYLAEQGHEAIQEAPAAEHAVAEPQGGLRKECADDARETEYLGV
jgi:hypothetical protein